MTSLDPAREFREAYFRKFSEDHDLQDEWMMANTDPDRFQEETPGLDGELPVINRGMTLIGYDWTLGSLDVTTCPDCARPLITTHVMSFARHCACRKSE